MSDLPSELAYLRPAMDKYGRIGGTVDMCIFLDAADEGTLAELRAVADSIKTAHHDSMINEYIDSHDMTKCDSSARLNYLMLLLDIADFL